MEGDGDIQKSASSLAGVNRARLLWLAALTGCLLWLVLAPHHFLETVQFVLGGFIEVMPLVIPGILLAAWVTASGAGTVVADGFRGHLGRGVVVASLIGAVTPVCGVTVLPLMVGLIRAGVPLAPVMAFWLSSPVTDPAMLATTAALLGPGFAVGKTMAALGLGLFGGLGVGLLAGRAWIEAPLRTNDITGGSGCGASMIDGFDWRIWREAGQRAAFRRETVATGRLIVICLTPAFAAEFLLNAALQPDALLAYVGRDSWWAVPLAVFVGAPAYIDGYAALPLTRSLIEHGMAPGAAMGFLVSGSVVSIWGAMAIAPVLKLKPFLLYLALALTGSLAAGWLYGWVA